MTSLVELREYILFLNTNERKRAYLEKSHIATILTVTVTNISGLLSENTNKKSRK